MTDAEEFAGLPERLQPSNLPSVSANLRAMTKENLTLLAQLAALHRQANALRALIVAYGQARATVALADTRTKFLSASADLWEAERALEAAAWQLEREGTAR